MKTLILILIPSLFLVSGCDLFEPNKSDTNTEVLPFHWNEERSFPENAHSIWISERDLMYIGGEEGWYLSTDYGDSFTKYAIPEEVFSFKIKKTGYRYYGYGQVHSDIHVINGDTTDAGFWGGSYNLYTSVDGNNWEKISGPYRMFDFIENDGHVYVGKEHGVVTYNVEKGEEFATDFLFNDVSVRVDEVQVNNKGEIFVGTLEGIYRSQDSGQSWTKVTEEIPSDKDHIGKIIVEGDEMYSVGEALLYSADSGENWRVLEHKMKNYEGEIKDHFMSDFDISKEGYQYSINYLGFFIYSESNADYFEFFGPEKYSQDPDSFPLRYGEVHAFKNGSVMITAWDNHFYHIGDRNESSDYWTQ